MQNLKIYSAIHKLLANGFIAVDENDNESVIKIDNVYVCPAYYKDYDDGIHIILDCSKNGKNEYSVYDVYDTCIAANIEVALEEQEEIECEVHVRSMHSLKNTEGIGAKEEYNEISENKTLLSDYILKELESKMQAYSKDKSRDETARETTKMQDQTPCGKIVRNTEGIGAQEKCNKVDEIAENIKMLKEDQTLCEMVKKNSTEYSMLHEMLKKIAEKNSGKREMGEEKFVGDQDSGDTLEETGCDSYKQQSYVEYTNKAFDNDFHKKSI